jgi:GT2 family glycosyltransferase
LQDKDKKNIETKQISSSKNETVCAVVVTYNRKKLLLECLEALKRQTWPLDAIYIIDNASTDGTPEILLKNNYIPKLPPSNLDESWGTSFSINNLPTLKINSQLLIDIHYIRMHENTGGAGGFYEGVKKGYEKGYDWLWLMDDDALPAQNSLEKLFIAINNLSDQDSHCVLWNQIIFDKNKVNKIFSKIALEQVDSAMFVGFAINSKLIRKVGLPNKCFFIYYDDLEYCLRIRRLGGKIFKVLGSFIYHKDWTCQKKIKMHILNKVLVLPDIPKWKYYYLSRNNILMNSHSNKAKFKAVLHCTKLWIKAAIIQPKFLTMITLGIVHGILGISGKRICI